MSDLVRDETGNEGKQEEATVRTDER